MIRRPPRSTRTDTLFPYTTLFRSEVNSVGGYRKQYVVAPVPTRLAGFGLTVEDVIEALESNTAHVGAGYVERSVSKYLIRLPGQAAGQGDFCGTIVRWREGGPGRIADIAWGSIGSGKNDGGGNKAGRER